MADIDIFGDEPVKETPEPMVTDEPVKEITEPMVMIEPESVEQQPVMQEAIELTEPTEEKVVVPEDGGTIDDDGESVGEEAALETVEKEADSKKTEVVPYVSHTNTVQVLLLVQE